MSEGGSEPSETGARRRRAALAGHEGDEATARALLGDAEPSVRATALGALRRLGALGDDELGAALVDPAPEVRLRALEVAATGSTPPTPALVALLSDPAVAVVEQAAWALGERADADGDVVAALARVAGGAVDALVREAAVAALGSIGDEAGLTAILAGTTDRPAVRRRAVLALAPFDGPEVDAALRRARTDRDWQVRQAAEDLLRDD